MKLRNKQTGEETEYIEGSTEYSEEFWELVEGEYIEDEDIEFNNIKNNDEENENN